MIWPSIRFDISLQNLKCLKIYIPTANRKKTFRRIFNHKFGCRKKTLRDFLASRSSSLKKANTGRRLKVKHNKTLRSVYFGVVVEELIHYKCGGIVRNEIWEWGVNLWNYGICQDILKRATSKRPTCQKLAFQDKLSLRY